MYLELQEEEELALMVGVSAVAVDPFNQGVMEEEILMVVEQVVRGELVFPFSAQTEGLVLEVAAVHLQRVSLETGELVDVAVAVVLVLVLISPLVLVAWVENSVVVVAKDRRITSKQEV